MDFSSAHGWQKGPFRAGRGGVTCEPAGRGSVQPVSPNFLLPSLLQISLSFPAHGGTQGFLFLGKPGAFTGPGKRLVPVVLFFSSLLHPSLRFRRCESSRGYQDRQCRCPVVYLTHVGLGRMYTSAKTSYHTSRIIESGSMSSRGWFVD